MDRVEKLSNEMLSSIFSDFTCLNCDFFAFSTLFVAQTATIRLVEFLTHLPPHLEIPLLQLLGVLHELCLPLLHALLHPHLSYITIK